MADVFGAVSVNGVRGSVVRRVGWCADCFCAAAGGANTEEIAQGARAHAAGTVARASSAGEPAANSVALDGASAANPRVTSVHAFAKRAIEPSLEGRGGGDQGSKANPVGRASGFHARAARDGGR